MSLVAVFVINLLAYAMLYGSYSYAVKTLTGRIVWVVASVAGMLLGSTLGERLFGRKL